MLMLWHVHESNNGLVHCRVPLRSKIEGHCDATRNSFLVGREVATTKDMIYDCRWKGFFCLKWRPVIWLIEEFLFLLLSHYSSLSSSELSLKFQTVMMSTRQ